MLVQNKPELGLQPHQLAAYRATRRGFKEKGKASVILPTGCGKSFVAIQTMLDFKKENILVTVPTIVIRNQYYDYIAKYIAGEEPTPERTARMIAEEIFPNLKITTYTAIQRANPELIKKLNPKLVINDEAHRSIADKTGEKMQFLFDSFPDAHWLGITATPERSDGKNVVDHFYEGTVDYELTLVQALRQRIVKAPNYIPCTYGLSDKLENVRKSIDECTDAAKKAKLEEVYEKLRNIVANAEGISELIDKNIQVKDGKVVVFCQNKEHMDELMSKVSEWFGKIDENPEVYSIYSGDGYTQVRNAETIEAYKKSESKHLKILFTVDMLNEGFHVPVDTLIMARPTSSEIVYKQQLGRGLSSDPEADPTTVFDLVNNYLNFDMDREINERASGGSPSEDYLDSEDVGELEKDEEFIPIDNFKVTGTMKDFVDLLEEVNVLIGEDRYVSFAEKIHEWTMAHKKFPRSGASLTKEENNLCSMYYKLKYRYIDKYMSLKTEEEKKAFEADNPHVDYVIGLIDEASRYDIPVQQKNAISILNWMKSHKYPVTPKYKSTDDVEVSLSYALGNLKRFVSGYQNINDDNQKMMFEQKHPEIFEVMDILKEINQINTPTCIINASEIREWIESQPNPRKPLESKPEEHKMARQFNTLKTTYVSKYKGLSNEKDKQDFVQKFPFVPQLVEIVDSIDEMCTKKSIVLQNAEDVKEWMIVNNATKTPSTVSENPEERRLGEAYNTAARRVREYRAIKDENKRKEYEDSHPELSDIIEVLGWIDDHTVSALLANTRAIRDWMEMPEHGKFPKKQLTAKGEKKEGFDESIDMQIEHDLGKKLNEVRSSITKFLRIDNEEEKEKYISKHKDIIKVMAITNDLDLRFGSKKQRELANLVHEDRALHEKLEAALALENEYRQSLNKENEQEKDEQGVDIDGV